MLCMCVLVYVGVGLEIHWTYWAVGLPGTCYALAANANGQQLHNSPITTSEGMCPETHTHPRTAQCHTKVQRTSSRLFYWLDTRFLVFFDFGWRRVLQWEHKLNFDSSFSGRIFAWAAGRVSPTHIIYYVCRWVGAYASVSIAVDMEAKWRGRPSRASRVHNSQWNEEMDALTQGGWVIKNNNKKRKVK